MSSRRSPRYPLMRRKRRVSRFARGPNPYPVISAGSSFNRAPRGATSIFKTVQTVDGADNLFGSRNITQGAAVGFANVLFELRDCPQSATFQALYDQYRIVKVYMYLIPQVTNAGYSANANLNNYGLIGSALTYDLAVPTTYAAFKQLDTLVVQGVTDSKTHFRSVNPRALVDTNSLHTGVAPADMWFSTQDLTVKYSGISIFVDAYPAATTAQNWHVQFKYFLEFKHTS